MGEIGRASSAGAAGGGILLDVFVPDHSPGLAVDAAVLAQALGEERVNIVRVPFAALGASALANAAAVRFEPRGRCAVFIERAFEHPLLGAYERRVLLPNPEWLTEPDARRARGLVTEVWHKTRFSEGRLAAVFHDKVHRQLGFTSPGGLAPVSSPEGFAHFAGKSRTRHTQNIIDLWLADPGLPRLTVQAYGHDLSIPRWIACQNVDLFLGHLAEKDYREAFSAHGIHLCTSQTEGFGHYINEARAIGALILALDAPPMNELIDADCGILIPTARTAPHHHGLCFLATRAAIGEAVATARAMAPARRRALGERARERFAGERQAFVERLGAAVA